MLLTASAVFSLMHFIAKREGFYHAGSLPQRNNNPCALVYAGQVAALPGRSKHSLAWFPTAADGWLACERDIRKKDARGGSFHRAWEYLR